MSIFDEYAYYYDTLYQEKQYEEECDFLEQVFAVSAANPVNSVLDLGCGTGAHALPLARRGYEVMGIDCSDKMLELARAKRASAPERFGRATFKLGDIRSLDLGRNFDAVIAMFAVISYQATNEDLLAAFRTARRHLEPGGLFVFDAWFGPAVLMERPSARVKTIEQNGERVIRFAKPTLDIFRHIVRVDYKILRLKNEQVLDEVNESHTMRFLFPQELVWYLDQVGLKVLEIRPSMELGELESEKSWTVTVISGAAADFPSDITGAKS